MPKKLLPPFSPKRFAATAAFFGIAFASLPLHAGPFDQPGMSARVFIELPLERVAGRTQGPNIGFALNHHVPLDGNASGYQTPGVASGYARSWAGVDIPLLDVRMDAQTASLRRVNFMGTDVLAMKKRLKADGGPAGESNAESPIGKGDILVGVILVGVVTYVYYQAEKGSRYANQKIDEYTPK